MKKFDTSKQFHVLTRILLLHSQNVNRSMNRVEIKAAKQTTHESLFFDLGQSREGLQSPDESKDFCGTTESGR
jgi:hypothetical protein